jgi:signal transduction histidine kinase
MIFLLAVMFVSFALIFFFYLMLSRRQMNSVTLPVESYSEILYSVIIVCLLLIISSFIFGRYLLERVGRPLDFLIQQIGDIHTVQIDKSLLHIKADDEIGMLIDSYNSMKAELSALYLEDRKIVELDKLAQIGRVATAITHEVKNPLAVIKSSIYYLEKLRDDGISDYIFLNEFGETKELIKNAITHAEHITYNLLDFSRSSSGKTESGEVKIGRMLEQIFILYLPDIMKKRIDIKKDLQVDPIYTELDNEICKTVLINLVSNAIYAMESEGVLTVSCSVEDTDHYRFQVSDTGGGVEEHELTEIFKPFYTSKETSGSAGLGLWIVQKEISRIGGEIYAQNNAENGLTIVVLLPVKGARSYHGG